MTTTPICTLIFGLALAANAQDRVANIDQNALSREAAAVGAAASRYQLAHPGVGEIGLIERHPVPDTLTLYTSQAASFTSNAFLAPGNEREDLFWSGLFGVNYVPYSVRDLTPSLNIEQSYFRYDEFGELDFDSLTLRAALKYDFDPNDMLFGVTSYGYNELSTSNGGVGEFYKYGLLTQTFTQILPLGSQALFLSLSLGSTYRHGDPSAFDRITTFFGAGLFYVPVESFTASLFVRPEGQFYLDDPIRSGRTDLNFIIGLGASYRFVEQASVGANFQFVGNDSNSSIRDYDAATLGLTLNLSLAF